jgi:phosphatidylserine/phosphatidylglycerophosphate/cardiolipin synthase-like enzyme
VQQECQNAGGGSLKLLVQPSDGVTDLLNAMHRAEGSIEIAIFRFDHAGIEEALTAAVKRGVSVQALIAHVNGSSAEALRKLEMRLLAAGVTVARTDTGLARYHGKYLIIDRRELFVLAFNFTRQDIEKSRSFGVVTKNRRLVQEAMALFEADSKRQQYKSGSSSFIVSPVNARKQLSSFIKGARSEIAIYDPRVSDRAMLRILQDRLEANVSIRIIGRVSDERYKFSVRTLARMRLHTRCIIRDRKALFLGSQSLRELELDGRREVGIVCRDRAAVATILNIFEEDWAASEHAPASPDDIRPVAKVAKRVAKAISTELPPVIPLLDGVANEIGETGADVRVAPDEFEETVRTAVKDAVKSVVQEALEQKMQEEPAADE